MPEGESYDPAYPTDQYGRALNAAGHVIPRITISKNPFAYSDVPEIPNGVPDRGQPDGDPAARYLSAMEPDKEHQTYFPNTEMRSRKETSRQMLSNRALGENPSLAKKNFVEGVFGGSGAKETSMGIIDMLGPGAGLTAFDSAEAYSDISNAEMEEERARRGDETLKSLDDWKPRTRLRDKTLPLRPASDATAHLGWGALNAAGLAPGVAAAVRGVKGLSRVSPMDAPHKPYTPSRFVDEYNNPSDPASGRALEAGVAGGAAAAVSPDEAEGSPLSALKGRAAKFAEMPKAKPKLVEPDPHYYDISNIEMNGPNKGTNPGGFAVDKLTGEQLYVKHPPNEDAANNEMLVAQMYGLTGIPVADIKLGKGMKPTIVSKIVPGEQLSKADPEDYAKLKHLRSNMVVDAWLRNWDSVGIGPENPFGNIMFHDGVATRIDTGGGLRYRGSGSLKQNEFGKNEYVIDDINRMRDGERSGIIFGEVTDDELKEGAQRVANVPPEKIFELVMKFGPKDLKSKNQLYESIVERQKAIAEHFGVTPQAPDEVPPSVMEGMKKALLPKSASESNLSPEEFGKFEKALLHPKVKEAPKEWADHPMSAATEEFAKHDDKQMAAIIVKNKFGLNDDEVGELFANYYDATGGKQAAKAAQSGLTKSETDFLAKKLGSSDEVMKELNMGFGGDKEMLLEAYGYDASRKDIVAHTIPAVKKEDPKPVSLAGGASPALTPEVSETKLNYIKGFLGKSFVKPLISGTLTQKQAKAAAGMLMDQSPNYTIAAQHLWRLAEANPHSAEALFRKFHPTDAESIRREILSFKKAEGSTPFDNITKVPGKFKTSHILSPVGGKKPKPQEITEDMKYPDGGGHYTQDEIEQYYKDQQNKDDYHLALAQGKPAIPYATKKDPLLGEVLDGWNPPGSKDPIWDKFLNKLVWKKYKPPGGEYTGKDVATPFAMFDPSSWGFNKKVKLYHGKPEGDLPEEWDRFHVNSNGEPGTFLADHPTIGQAYKGWSGKVHEFIAAAKDPVEVDWRKINGGHPHYSGSAMRAVLYAAKERGHDFVILHNMSDLGSMELADKIGSGLHTQYVALDSAILRSTKAKFDPAWLKHAKPLAGVSGAFLIPLEMMMGEKKGDEKPKYKRGGAVGAGKVERALRTARKYAAGGPLDLMPDKNDTSAFAPHTQGLLGSPVPGRTDKLPIKVKPGSYVIPADIVSSSALGQGNTLAGSKVLDIGFAKHRMGAGKTAYRSTAARLRKPSGNATMPKQWNAPRSKFADGGAAEDIPIIAAGGEYICSPEVVQSLGDGDAERGHDALDAFVKRVRQHNIKTLKKLPPPKRG